MDFAADDLSPKGALILDAALTCIGRVGLAKTTLDDVAREARCARATVYRCFANKQQLLAALVSGPLKVPKSPSPVTYDVGNAAYPIVIGGTGHIGIILAILAAGFVWWLLFRTTWGFEIRAVGASPDAARYAGMRPKLLTVATMTFSGALAGLAGTSVLLGGSHSMTSSFGTTVGFDSIAVALLARSNPLAVLPAALLFGSMRAGAGLMQINAGIPVELVDVLQATILLFLVASPVLRRLLRLRNVQAGIATTAPGQSLGAGTAP